jgi:hypothetical protein
LCIDRQVLKTAGKIGLNVSKVSENAFLEAMRKRLFVENQPSKEFGKWMHESAITKKHVKPPV